MPRRASRARAGILEWLVLKPFRCEADLSSVGEKKSAIGGDEVRQRPAFPGVTMEPEAAIHGVDHPVAPRSKLDIARDVATAIGHQLQAMTPSVVAGAIGLFVP